MNKVFLYLYPIEEYTKMFLFCDNPLDKLNDSNPLAILNECIERRYRDKGFQIVFALYHDKNIYGINLKPEDKIIYNDVTFDEVSIYDSEGNEKSNFIPKIPNDFGLLNQLGNVDELVIGGYHFGDCVKKVGETALKMGINITVDLDLTDLFFNLYKNDEYFKIDEYNPQRYMAYWKSEFEKEGEPKEFIDQQFKRMYDSSIYNFYPKDNLIHKK